MGERELVRYRSFSYDSVRWRDFRLRPGDIVVSTPPKCGTTWTQMICLLLVLQRTELGAPLGTLSPWLDMVSASRRDVLATLEAQTHRRVIKTHTPLDGLPWDDSVTYICVARDPRDTALSMAAHRDNLDLERFGAERRRAAAVDGVEEGPPLPAPPDRPATPQERFWRWVDDDEAPTETASSLLRTLRHLGSFWAVRHEPAVVLLHYDDLTADLEGEMRALARRLDIEVHQEGWPALVEAAGFDSMRSRAEALAPSSLGRSLWRDPEQFFRAGTSGQWRDLLDDADLDRYRRRVRALVDPDLARWAHGEAGL